VDLVADCSRCVGLCCVLLPFQRSADFAFDKAAGEPCRHLDDGHRCRIHASLLEDLDGSGATLLPFSWSGVTVSARPSDAIALAMRNGTTIYAEESVLAEAGVAIPDEQENEVEKFREFLDQVSPEDFETGS